MQELPIANKRPRKPSWLKVKLPIGENYKKVRGLVDEYQLHTNGEVGNEKMKDTIVINTLYNLGIEIIYRNIGG